MGGGGGGWREGGKTNFQRLLTRIIVCLPYVLVLFEAKQRGTLDTLIELCFFFIN